MIWAILYHLYNLKKREKTPATFSEVVACNFTTKSNTPPWVFLRFLNFTNGTRSSNASQL